MPVEKVEHKDIPLIPKGWGYEKWIENNDEYCGKLLYLDKGKKTSLHYHKNKLETMYLQKGKVNILFLPDIFKDLEGRINDWHDDTEQYDSPEIVELSHGESIIIPRGVVHSIIALEDSELFEFSTHHEDSDSYRVYKGD